MKQITINHWMLGEILAPKLTCRAKIVCTCICGTIKHITWDNIKSNRSKSCGCAFGLTKHGYGDTANKTYSTWHGMKQRCDNPNNDRYSSYGGRGITYDPRWADFKLFLADLGEIPEGMTIDRINNDGNYEKSNIRFADQKTQQNNRRSNRLLTYKGETKTVSQWAEQLNMKWHTLGVRLHRGWTVEEAIETPVK